MSDEAKDAARYRYLKTLARKTGCVETPPGLPSRDIEWWTIDMVPWQNYRAGKVPSLDSVIDGAIAQSAAGDADK